MYVIVRCKLDEKVSTEAEFSPEDSPSVRVEGTLENEYTVSVKAPGEWPHADTRVCALLPSETLLFSSSLAEPSPAPGVAGFSKSSVCIVLIYVLDCQ